jgi:hypothetical protein
MPLSRRDRVSVLVLVAVSLPCARAHGQEASAVNAQCVQAYEQGQIQRKTGGLLEARSTLQQCAQDECPDFIRNDCLEWFAEVQNDVPSLVFAAKSQGRDLSDVRVSLGSRVLTSRIDGQLLELDPGEYEFRFESPGMQSQTKHFVLATGERHRLVQVDLVPLSVAAAEEAVPTALPPRKRSLLLPGIFVGVGAVGLGGFAGLGAWGRTQESKLELTCAPHCRKGQLSDVRTKYLLADVSLGVGVVSLALGAYFFLRQDDGEAPAVGVSATTRTATLTYGGAF